MSVRACACCGKPFDVYQACSKYCGYLCRNRAKPNASRNGSAATTTVGDIEILYIPRFTTEPDGLFDKKQVNQVDRALESLIATGLLAKRTNVIGSESWGPKNKYARHCRAGIPLDLFEATESNWFNYLVCRTGSAGNNTLIASAAIKKGWKWHPYASGFTDNSGRLVQVHSEKDVFTHVGLPYREPWER